MKILVVEDDFMVAMLMEEMLTDLGHEVIGPAFTVEEAMLLTDYCDVAILDMNLGAGETSLPIADELERTGKRFAFATGSAPDRHSARLFLGKPYNISALEEMLTTLSQKA